MAVERKLKKYYIWVIMLVALLIRTVYVWRCPAGINADEAFAGYEAWSLANYGIDSAGYVFPVYLTVWGSGMSVLNSLLMIPFVKLYGLNIVTVKLPAMIMGIVSVYIFYLLLKKAANERLALWGSFLLAISPWHIMISRYGMDANLAPAFVLIAMYLTVLGIEDNRKLVLAGAAWGISLYSYAVLWIFVPVFLTLTLIYCIKCGKITDYRQLAFAAVVLLVIALPLILFVCVNMGWIDEVRTGFISIPKLAWFRMDDVNSNGRGYVQNIKKLIKCYVLQNDELIWNSTPYFGIYYLFSTPISIVGFIAVLKRILKDRQEKEFSYALLLFFWVLAALVMDFSQSVGINLNRSNALTPAMFIFVAVGIVCIIDFVSRRWKRMVCFKVESCMVGIYVLGFVCFMVYYFIAYNQQIGVRQQAGAQQALYYAEDLLESGDYDDTIYVTGQVRHSQVLFYMQVPTEEYIETVEYNGIVDGNYDVKSFSHYEWGQGVDTEGIHIILQSEMEEYEEQGFDVEEFEACAVAFKKVTNE